MPDLSFQITGVEPGDRGLAPTLYFNLRVTNAIIDEPVQAILLRTQIQLEPARRAYEPEETEKLSEVFGKPERWGQTLRNKLWTHVDISVPAFTNHIDVQLPVPCTYDLNVLAAKYFYALQGGQVSILFLFSGTIFQLSDDGRMQVEQISWEKECACLMPAATWRELMEQFFPQSVWIYLPRETFDRFHAYMRQTGFTTWEEAVDHMLTSAELSEDRAV